MRKTRTPFWEPLTIVVIVLVGITLPQVPLQREGYALAGVAICAIAAGVALEMLRRINVDPIGQLARRLLPRRRR